MSLRSNIHRVRESLKVVKAPLSHQEECEKWAEEALRSCSFWFGPPRDPKHGYWLSNSPHGSSSCCYCFGSYGIFLSEDLNTPEKRCEVVAHEIYHRVTMRRCGLRREDWVDEILAFLASQWFLRHQGFEEYARKLRHFYATFKTPVDVPALRRVRRRRIWKPIPLNPPSYPENFGLDTARLATALNLLVEFAPLQQLPWAKSLDAWVDSLPADRRIAARRLLQLPGAGELPADDAELHFLYSEALRHVGRWNEALAANDAALRLQPDRAAIYFGRGFILEALGRLDEEGDAWLEGARLDPANVNMAFNAASVYARKKAYGEAIPWYREALRRAPDNAKTLYYLGAALAKENHVEEARACWQRILDTGDDWYDDAARGSLAAWADTAAEQEKVTGGAE